MEFKINNINDLRRALSYAGRHVKIAIQEVGKVVEEEIKNYIMKNLYNAYNPTSYTRTYDYINSLTVGKVKQDTDGKYTVEIYFDTDKIMPRPSDGAGRWSRHSSITNGEDVSDMIPIWIEYGVEGSLWDREGIYAIENAKKTMEETKYHLFEIKKILEKRGFRIEIK